MNFLLVLEWLIKGFVWAMVLLGGFAYLTYYERRALARIQVRIGPNRAGPFGLLQPIADAIKLIFKEEFMPARADKLLFWLAPIVTLTPALVITAVVPFGSEPFPLFGRTITWQIADINVVHSIAYDKVKKEFVVRRSWRNSEPEITTSFEEAQTLVSRIESLKIIPLSRIAKGSQYQLQIKAEASRKTLPLGLNTVLFFISFWDVATDWYVIDFTY